MSEQKYPIIGCIADDFTGASDIASFFAKGGLSTAIYNGIPSKNHEGDMPGVMVIALKTRALSPKEAVSQSLAALDWLKKQGVKQMYFKYCSTFNSTAEGNIGPVADAVLEKYDIPYTVLCPSLPVNGRIVRGGHLYVDGVPLHESPMGEHPLTPMRDSDVCKLMQMQSSWMCMPISRQDMQKDASSITDYMADVQKRHPYFYVVPDYEFEEDAQRIVEIFGHLPFLTGGSGLGWALAEMWTKDTLASGEQKPLPPLTQDKMGCLTLSGSCSEVTNAQVAHFINRGGASLKIVPEMLASGEQTIGDFMQFVEDNRQRDILLYSTDTPSAVRKNQELGIEKVLGLIEGVVARVAAFALKIGISRITVAGGETSGAVTQALGYDSFFVGESVEEGVPIMIPTTNSGVRIVLKSGNFGKEDFFTVASDIMKTGK